MDPLTHMVTGAMVAQALSPEEHRWTFALVAAGAAVVPDIDFMARKAPGRLLFLKLHRGLTHSLLALPLIAACASGCGNLLFGTPFWPLFTVSLLAALSHLVLDTIMHSTGLQWLWPLRRRLSLPLVIGLNPLTSSARCGERSLFVCLRCTMHSAVISPMVLLLWLGFVVSLLVPQWRLVSQLALAAGGLYILLCILLRLRARSLLRARIRSDRLGVYPGGFNPAHWLGVALTDEKHDVWRVDALGGGVELQGQHGPSADDPAVGASRQTATVEEFMDNAVFPHATVHAREAGQTVIWRDLAFAFSPCVSLFAARIDLDGELGVTYEEFRERWDGPPERAPARLASKGAAQASPPT
jgi:membrane-bound metal-dependent hydrolase YbcI (DUF457 family)